jgi:hypothetical protein
MKNTKYVEFVRYPALAALIRAGYRAHIAKRNERDKGTKK